MRKLLLMLTFMVGLTVAIFAQSKIVTGTVTDEDGIPLAGATVVQKSTDRGTITNEEGYYEIEIDESLSNVLNISYVGYLSEEIITNGKSVIDVILISDVTTVEELVVIGYGVQKKSLVTGSISRVDADNIVNTPAVRIEQALQGKIAGVSVAQSSGAPGGELTVRVRGTGSNEGAEPLYIVDGMKTTGIEYLDPNDIEHVEVLKDAASAAIYGSEGANGVVLITTKSGIAGKSQVNYSFYYGMQTLANKVEMLNGQEYVQYFTDALLLEGEDLEDIRDTNSAFYIPDPGTVGEGTDWIEETFTAAPIQNHYLSFMGGNETTTYNASFTYYNQDGIVGGSASNFKRYTGRLNVNYQPNKWLSGGARLTYSIYDKKLLNENNEFGGVVTDAIFFDPLTPVYYESDSDIPSEFAGRENLLRNGDGKVFGLSTRVQNELRNPITYMDMTHDKIRKEKIMVGAYASAEVVKGLKFNTAFDVDATNSTHDLWTPKYYIHGSMFSNTSRMEKEMWRYFNWQWENYFTYSLQIANHSVNVMAGISALEKEWYNLRVLGEDLVKEQDNFAILDYTLNDTLDGETFGDKSQNRLASAYGRIIYNYKERYLFNFTIRRDGSDKFGDDNKFATFPSVSLGWIVSNEDFWNVNAVNSLKIKASWGQNGSLSNLENFAYVPLITSNNVNYTDANGALLPGAVTTSLSNNELKWETSEQLNIGFDIALLENKLNFSFDYFKKSTIDLLFRGSVADYVGNNAPWVNAGQVDNKGFEFELGYRNYEGKFKYDLSLNASKVKNEVVDLPEDIEVLSGDNLNVSGTITRAEEGRPIWYFYGYRTDGIWNSQEELDEENRNDEGRQIQTGAEPGDIRIVDIDTSGRIDSDDKTMIGNPFPDWVLGFTTNLYYFNFDLGMTFTASIGNDVYNGLYRSDIKFANKPKYFLEDAWSEDNPDAEWFRPTYSSRWNFEHNDFFVQDGSYLKLKNIQLGYTIPASLLQKVKIQNLRLYVAANNVLTLTKYKGMDPEIGNSRLDDGNPTTGQVQNSIGLDRGLYPQARSFIFGVNLTF